MYIADLHIHSRYSRATSKEGTVPMLDLWASRKGIGLVGTGDFTHPAWRKELEEMLVPDGSGLYVLREDQCIEPDTAAAGRPRFVVTGEISSIYKKDGKVRKVHSLIILPGLEAAEKISKKLETIGNIHSDGRPILGLDCKDLLEIVLELCPEAIFVPAHIWTPHFSVFGAFSGFDTLEQCFEDLTPHIHALETGLSSDPPMNWRVSALDGYQLVSNSDAHSPAKLGREANLLSGELSYAGLKKALETGQGLEGTIEFFPEEGKYHFDGHRKCHVCLTPEETQAYGGLCPVCGKKITIGVSNRVMQLADRPEGYRTVQAKSFESLMPLPEVIGASLGHAPSSAAVTAEYMNMVSKLGPEFEILRHVPLEDIAAVCGERTAKGIGRLREGKVRKIPGFDGEYGTIELFTADEMANIDGQMDFFSFLGVSDSGRQKSSENRGSKPQPAKPESEVSEYMAKDRTETLNGEQKVAAAGIGRATAVIAGPGTGKTKTLISKILHSMTYRKVKPSKITAVTFTNQAAAQMRARLAHALGKKSKASKIQIGTFHAISRDLLLAAGREVLIADDSQQRLAAQAAVQAFGLKMNVPEFLRKVSLKKSGHAVEDENGFEEACRAYCRRLREEGLMDFDDLLLEAIAYAEEKSHEGAWEKSFEFLLIDEFQDISPLEYRLIRLWSRHGKELFVIGDPDQAIYGFRGADAKCFERIENDFETTKIVHLTQNYRSASHIIDAATALISHNPGGARILCAVGNFDTEMQQQEVRMVHAKTPMSEAIFIAKEINHLVGGIGMLEAHALSGSDSRVRGFDDIAVLYRTHRQAQLLEKCLAKEGIPYVVAGREDFLTAPSVSASLSFFKCLADRENETLRRQCLSGLWQMEDNPISQQVLDSALQKFGTAFQKKKPAQFMALWIKEMHFENDEAMSRLSEMMVFYKNMKEFLDAVTMGIESDLKRCGGKNYTSGAVTLMTMHGAKGLEFNTVFISGFEEGKIPFESSSHAADIEEERRLLYVGMTRAKEMLIMTGSGNTSVFEKELDGHVVREEAHKSKTADEQWQQMRLPF